MPRKPFKPFADRNPGGRIDIGTRTLTERPALLTLVGKCLTAWPHIEAEMALVLGQLLGAHNSDAAMAVFQALRRSSAQRDAIFEAGRALHPTDRDLLSAVLNVHKSVEAERNALAHGHLGTYSFMPRKRGEHWTKEIDYVYLGFGFLGLMASVGKLQNVPGNFNPLPGMLGPMLVATAIVLRVIKTRAEIAGWNKMKR
jgi:hypothetical protein